MELQANLKNDWEWLLQQWVKQKQQAQRSSDWKYYLSFLRELKKEFGKVYAGFTNEKWIALFDELFQTLTCELKETIIKSKNSSMQSKKKKSVEAMADDELMKAYVAGCNWLTKNMQFADESTVPKPVAPYNPALYEKGVQRVEQIEKEMQKRGLAY